jgi:pimeloyl-ACP methyl ester carboxylesterase
VLIGAATRFDQAAAKADALAPVVTGRARRQFDPSGFAKGCAREVFGRAFAEWLKTDPRVTRGDWEALAGWSAGGWLGEIEAPALVIDGDAAPDAVRASAAALAGLLPAATLGVLPGCGAFPALEQPAALAAQVSAFCAERVR